jgi:hypothetical protein
LTTELTQEDLKNISAVINTTSEEELKRFAKSMSLLIRTFSGEQIDPDSVMEFFTDIKRLTERSNFPTYGLIARQVYLRLVARIYPEAIACLEWADEEAHAMISYQGLSRNQLVEMKRAANQTGQLFQIGTKQTEEPKQEAKSHFWTRSRNEKRSEFEE